MNNAFISYRNAADIFLKNEGLWYGVSMPQQLKQDVLYALQLPMALQKKYGIIQNCSILHCSRSPDAPGGELILFWENGLAPVKQEQNFFFALTRDGLGQF